MLLAQKPQSISFRHRRQPASLSAITVVPHPTNTPGLFAIAKPIRQQPRPLSRPQSPRCTPRGRPHRSQHQHQHPHRHHPHPSLNVAHFPGTVKEMNASSSDSSQSPSKKTTGAQNEDFKAVSHIREAPAGVPPLATDAQSPQRSPRPRRSRHKSTPAVSVVPSTRTLSLEFNSGQPPTTPDRSMPEKNQENKALSRIPDTRIPSPVQQHPLPPATPIPVPERRRNQSPSHTTPLSKSEPGKSKLTIQTFSPAQPPKSSRKRRKNKPKRLQDGSNLPLSDWDFPVKESDDDGEAEVEDTEPSSPVRTVPAGRRSWLNDGPKTAPLEPSRQQFPFFTFPTRASPRSRTPAPRSVDPFALAPAALITPPRQIRSDHRRAPSQPASLSRGTFIDGVFHFSDDEGDRSPVATDIQKKMAMLFGKRLASDEAGFSSSVPPLLSTTSTPSPRRKMGRERDR